MWNTNTDACLTTAHNGENNQIEKQDMLLLVPSKAGLGSKIELWLKIYFSCLLD